MFHFRQIVFFFFFILLSADRHFEINETEKLEEHPTFYHSVLLKQNYERLISPYELYRKTMNVNISVPFTILFSVEESRQIVSYIAAVEIEWNDPRLAFDPKEMGYDFVLVPSLLLWIPLIDTFNSVEIKFADREAPSNLVSVHHSGRATITMKGKFDTVCGCDVEGFPFDVQLCNINFATGMVPVEQLLLHVKEDDTFLIGLPEWKVEPPVLRSSIYDSETFGNRSLIIASFKLTRNPQFYIYFLVLPTWAITILCVMSLLLPLRIGQGEKLTLGISGILGFTFMLSVIVGEVPRSPKLPLMGKWLILQMFYCIVAMFWELPLMFLIQMVQKRFTRSKNTKRRIRFILASSSCALFVISDLLISYLMLHWKPESVNEMWNNTSLLQVIST